MTCCLHLDLCEDSSACLESYNCLKFTDKFKTKFDSHHLNRCSSYVSFTFALLSRTSISIVFPSSFIYKTYSLELLVLSLKSFTQPSPPALSLSLSHTHSNRQNDKFVRKVFSICKSSRKLGQLSVGTGSDMGTYVPHSRTILPLCLRDLITYSINLICMQQTKRGKETHKSLQKQNTKNKRRAESQLELVWRSVEEGYP